MNGRKRQVPVRQDNTGAVATWLQDTIRQLRLAWRLFRDQRVPVWTKLIPPLVLTYIIFPVDLIPDLTVGLGQLDDIAVLLLGLKLFIELSPPDVVREHLRTLGARLEEWRVVDEATDETYAVIEGKYAVKGFDKSEPVEAEVVEEVVKSETKSETEPETPPASLSELDHTS